MMNYLINKLTVKFFLSFFCLLCSIHAYGQHEQVRIVDENEDPIAYANVVFLHQKDKTFITGTVSDNLGYFSIPDTLSGNKQHVIVKISCIGYIQLEAKLSEVDDRGFIMLQEDINMLEEIVVKANKQPFKMKQGVLVADIQGSLLSRLGTANDVLDKIPFVTQSNSGLTVFGRGTPLVYINNRQLRDNSELALLSSRDIKDISVITSPGAEYDASVGSVIRITTLRPQGEGFSNTAYSSVEKGSHIQGIISNAMNYRVKAFDLFASIAYSRNNREIVSDQEYSFLYEKDHTVQISNQDQHIKSNSILPSAGVNFNPSSKKSMGISYRGVWASTKIPSSLNILTYKNQIAMETQEEHIFNSNNNNQHIFNGYYNYQSNDKSKFELSTDAVFGGQNLLQDVVSGDNTGKIDTKSRSSFFLFAGKGNWEYSLPYGILRIGTEYTKTRFEQSYEIGQTDIGLSDNSNETRQNRLSFFSTYNLKRKYWGINAGVRYELISGEYYSNGELQKEQSPEYRHFFPSATLSYDTEKWQLALSYHSKITYPTYTQLRDFANYISPVVYESGNPNLKPTLSYTTQLSFARNNFRFIASYGMKRYGIYSTMSVMEDRPVIMRMYENINKDKFMNAVSSYTFKLDLWQSTIEIGAHQQWLDIAGVSYDHTRWSYRFLNSLSFPKQYVLRVDFTGYSKGHNQLTYYNTPSYYINLRLSKSFKNLDVNLSVNDILQTTKQNWSVLYDSIQWHENKFYNFRNLTLSLTYRINATNRRYKGRTENDELNRLQ